MQRSRSIVAFALMGVACVSAWNIIRANEEESLEPVSAIIEVSDMQKLVDRIDALEKRLAAMEAREPSMMPIRQVDSRSEEGYPVPAAGQLMPNRTENNWREDDDDSNQTTNRQKWRVRLLGHRKSAVMN